MKVVEDNLKVAEEKLKDAEDKMKEFEVETRRAWDAFAAEARAREDELVKRHQSWPPAEGQSSTHPAPGDQVFELDQELQDTLLELEITKLDLAGAEQDITN